MKKISFFCMLVFVFSLVAGSAFAQSYCQDVLEPGNPGGRTTGLKTCDTVNPETLNPGDTFSIDIWAAEIPEPIITSGFEMFYNPAQVSLVSVLAYDGVDIAGGPWDGTATLKIPDAYGPGSYVLAVVQLGTCPVPDAGGDIIVAQATFQCTANGTGNISVKGIDSFDTTVGCTSGVVYDATMGTNALSVTIAAAGCTGNAQCDDGIYCNGAETCNIGTGICQPGTAVVCNDGIACTTDSCNEATDSCDYIPNNAACADGTYCNGIETCNPASGCVPGTPVSCPDDGLFCNGIESCNEATDSCTSSGDPCTPPQVCNEGTDTCAVVGCTTDPECNDGLYCNGTETCNTGTGQCQAGTLVDCNDGVACTTDSCNESMDMCDNTTSDAACSDGLFCNGNEVCDPVSGCLDGTPVNCPDDGAFCNGTESCDEASDACISSGNPCTTPGTVCNEETNVCDQAPGCEGDAECDNGLYCDGAETCVEGSCQNGIPVDCNDEVACTTDSCNEATDSCDHAPNNAVCDDGNFCNGNELCTVTGCQPGTPVECPDDGLFCNGTESCSEAADSCVSSGNPCAPGTTCNEQTDFCDEVPVEGCTSDKECDDGIFCNGIETCSVAHVYTKSCETPPVTGVCKAGTPVDCNDGVDCTTDSCNEAMDKCDHAPDNAVCDDGNFCNGNEVCDPVKGCQDGTAVSCADDGLFCNGTESCNEAKDSCASSGNPCTPGITVCNEESDKCDPLQEGCKSDAECDDGIFCNGIETCNAYAKATGTTPPVAGVCQAGIPVDCNDGVDCTVDSCNEANDTCDHAPDNAVCDDGNFCNGNEVCDPYAGSMATQESTGSKSGCKDGEAVKCPDDGLFCNGTESCNEAADSCQSSGNPCTPGITVCNEESDKCDPLQEGCKSDADCNDDIFCNGIETCNAYAKSTGTTTPVTGVCQAGIPVDCNDGVDCTMDSCNEDTESCVNTADDAYCPDDGKFCNGTEFCDPLKGCISTGDPCAAGTVCNEEKDSCEQKQITVKIDIKPGSCPNPLNLKSKGVLPAAILGSKDFDVKNIDPMTIVLSREGIAGGAAPIRYNYADVATPFEGELCDCNSLYGDGYKDLTLKFNKAEVISDLLLSEVAGQTIPLTITFSLKEDKGGTAYSAEDCLKILTKKEKKDKKIKVRRGNK